MGLGVGEGEGGMCSGNTNEKLDAAITASRE